MPRRALLFCLLAGTPALAADVASGPDQSHGALLQGREADAAFERRAGRTTDLPSLAELEQKGAIVGQIDILVEDIFDEDDPQENYRLYRLANRLHLDTRDSTIRAQVLLQTGQPLSARKAAETERVLRDKRYLYDARVEPVAYDAATNTVDLLVSVRDVWSLSAGVGVGRSGGTNKSRARIVDENFLGRGQLLALGYSSTVDRSGVSLNFQDQNVLDSWWRIDAGYTDNDDGGVSELSVTYPFYSLESHWSGGISAVALDQVTPLYDLGEISNEFREEHDYLSLDGGWSAGLRNGWATRWLAGYRYDRSRFSPAPDPADTLLLPEDQTLSYPYVGVEIIQDRFATTRNQDQIGRTEDVYLGTRLRLELGWTASAFGGDRSAGIFSAVATHGRLVGRRGLVLTSGYYNGRLESGSPADALLGGEASYYLRFNEKNVFTAGVEAAHGTNLDLDHQILLGGDNGLRGYPLRYQGGDTRALLSVEERYFTDWFPFHLVQVGGAVFADVGRTWGQAPLATEPQGWLSDVGFGLRLGNARSGLGNVLHIDMAFPLGASSDISSTQFLLEVHRAF